MLLDTLYTTAVRAGLDVPNLITSGLKIDPQRMGIGLDQEELLKHGMRVAISIGSGFLLTFILGQIHNSTEPRERITLQSEGFWYGVALIGVVTFTLFDGINSSELGVDLAD